MYNGTNLVTVAASCISKYITGLMPILFTSDELKNGLIIESTLSTSERTPLDKERVAILKSKIYFNCYKLF
jgi:hypothetical protein